MKAQLSLTPLWLAPALAVLAYATVDYLSSFVVHQSNLARIAEASDSTNKDSSCGIGIKGQYSNVHHGWVCSTEPSHWRQTHEPLDNN